MRIVSLDDSTENADWTKQSWDLPPYGSKEFAELGFDPETFKQSPIYQMAVNNGLILDDEWVADSVADWQGFRSPTNGAHEYENDGE